VYQFISFERSPNIFEHSNHFAYVLVICFIFLLKTKIFILAPILYLILIASLIMTKTTGAMLTLVVFLVFHYHAKIKSIYIRIPIIALVLLFFIFGFSFFPKIIEQISSLQYLDWTFIKEKALNADPGGYGSFMWRVIYWTQILIAFFDNNSIVISIGEGIDSLSKTNRDMYGFLYTDPHNDFIKILVEYGVVGLSLFILLLYRLYTFLGRRVDILLILAIPLFFDNMIVNWSYNIVFLLYITYFYKAYILKR
jgi:O-antigen ligase